MRYNAFISYRHLPKDKFVAETLHRTLEGFKLPKSLYGKVERHTIERVFRDRDELPLSSNLSEPIDEALKESEFLIVICTPQLKESRWCMREIETFKTLHGREKIFVVLAEGEPFDSFPDALLYDEVEQKDENGNTVIVKKPVEPLAADVRGKNFRQIRKLIKEESIRLIAPMLGLDYDDLKQRHREREIKRKIRIASVIAGVFLVFGIVSASMAWQIHKQNIEIKNNYAKSLSAESETLYAEGNLNLAREKADLALEYSETDETQHTHDLVNGELTAYGTHSLSQSYEMEDGVGGMFVSPGGELIAAASGLSDVVILETATGTKTELSSEAIAFTKGYADFVSDSRFLYNSQDGLCLYDYSDDSREVISSDFAKIVISDDRSYVGLVGISGVEIFDASSMKSIAKIDVDVNSDCAADFSADGKLFEVAMSGEDINNGFVYIIDVKTGKVISQNGFEGGFPVSISCTDSEYALSLCDATGEGYTSGNVVQVYDKDGELKWQTEADYTMYNYVDYCGSGNDTIFTYQPNKFTSFDSRTGKVIDVKPTSDTLYLCEKTGDGNYTLTFLGGDVVEYIAAKKSTRTIVNYEVHPTLKCAEAAVRGNSLYCHFMGVNYISVYSVPEGEVSEVISDDAAEFLADVPDNMIYFQEAITRAYNYDESLKIPDKEAGSMIIHSPNKKYFACYGDGKSVRVYKYGEEEPVYSLSINTGTVAYMIFSEGEEWFAVSYQNGNLDLFDAKSGEAVVSLEKDYPYTLDVISVTEENSIIIDTAYETKIMDEKFNERTKYPKTADMMCVGYNPEDNTLIIQSGTEIKAVPLE